MKIDALELERIIHAFLPNASVDEDNTGQLIIYTSVMLEEDGSCDLIPYVPPLGPNDIPEPNDMDPHK